VKKQGLLDFFGKGARVPAPTKEGTPIEAVTKRRDNLEENSPDSRKRESTKQSGGHKERNTDPTVKNLKQRTKLEARRQEIPLQHICRA
jgi:hypothetical protein